MWNKIKNWFGWIAGALIGFLMLILKLKNNKIEKQKDEISSLEKENTVKDVEMKVIENAKKEEHKQAEEAIKIKDEATQKVKDVKAEKISYNDIIKEWNNEK